MPLFFRSAVPVNTEQGQRFKLQGVKRMHQVIRGLSVTTFFYMVTLWASFALFHAIFDKPFDHDWDLSGNFIGLFMVSVPYIAYGLILRHVENRPVRRAVQVSLLTVVCERVSIYWIGSYFAANGYGNPIPLQFIRGEAAPYFSIPYIFIGGIVSVLLCVAAAGVRWRKS